MTLDVSVDAQGPDPARVHLLSIVRDFSVIRWALQQMHLSAYFPED